jgi:hypothetical protein
MGTLIALVSLDGGESCKWWMCVAMAVNQRQGLWFHNGHWRIVSNDED